MTWSRLTDLQRAAAECAHHMLSGEGGTRQTIDAIAASFQRGKNGIPGLTSDDLQEWVKAYRDHTLTEKIRLCGSGSTAAASEDDSTLSASDLADLRFSENPEAELLAGISQFTALVAQRPAVEPLPEPDRLALIDALRRGQPIAPEDRQNILSVLESVPHAAANHPAALLRQFLQFLLPRKKPVRLTRRVSTVRVPPGYTVEVWSARPGDPTAPPLPPRLATSMTVVLAPDGTVHKCLPFTRPNVQRTLPNGTRQLTIRTATPDRLASPEAIAARVIAAVAFVEGQVYGQTGQAAIAGEFGWSRARYEYHEDTLRSRIPTTTTADRAAMPGRKNITDPRRGQKRSAPPTLAQSSQPAA